MAKTQPDRLCEGEGIWPKHSPIVLRGKGREYGQNTARSYCDQVTAKLVGQCGLMTDEIYD